MIRGLDNVLRILNEVPVRPTEARNVDGNELADVDAAEACARLVGVAVMDAKGIFVPLSYTDRLEALTALVFLPRADDLAAVDGRPVIVAIAIEHHSHPIECAICFPARMIAAHAREDAPMMNRPAQEYRGSSWRWE